MRGHRHESRLDIAFLLVFAGLLAYTILASQHLFGLGPLARPRPLIWINVALFSQALGRLLRRSSRRTFYALTVLSLAALIIALMPR